MATTDESVTGESTESAARPLLWNRPRLRFVDDAPKGAAGTPPANPEDPPADDPPEDPDPADDPPEDPPADPNAGAKKALTAERIARKAAEKALATLKAELALKDKPAEEQALEAARAEARAEATTKANERIARAEVKAAATGKLKNPALALQLITISEIEVSDDGEVDSDAVNQAIADLLEKYPELAADGSKFTGTADQGAKGKSSKPAQLSRADVERMKAAGDNAGIVAAQANGQLNDLLGIK